MNDEAVKMIDIRDLTEEDYVDYGYALCSCPLPLNYAVRVPRPRHSGFVGAICPKCGRVLGVYLKGRER